MADPIQQNWISLREQLRMEHNDISPGRMMSADALTYRGKVFVFFSEKGGRVGLGCRIDRSTNVASLDLTDWHHLAPFKSKPPMKDWIVIGYGDVSRWKQIAELCLTIAKQRNI
ncbi:MAG: hypothetical protein AAFR39_04930 [Pseudomonadota bacterium]